MSSRVLTWVIFVETAVVKVIVSSKAIVRSAGIKILLILRDFVFKFWNTFPEAKMRARMLSQRTSAWVVLINKPEVENKIDCLCRPGVTLLRVKRFSDQDRSEFRKSSIIHHTCQHVVYCGTCV